jgi:hypothetical protein
VLGLPHIRRLVLLDCKMITHICGESLLVFLSSFLVMEYLCAPLGV